MADAKYDVLGIGNAIFDVLVQTDEAFLARHGMTKGGMALIDEARALAIYNDMGPATEMSGGSAANTIVGIANLGARAAYVGKVRDDQIGRLYTHDIRAAGVTFETPAAAGGPATGCSYILVTPDGERTMNTWLGAAQELTPADIDEAQIAASGIIYLEGYLWDPKSAKEAFVKAATIAHGAGRQVALTLVGFILRRSLPRRVSRSDAQGHRRSDLRQRSRTAARCTRPRISTPHWRNCARTPNSESSPAARKAASWPRKTASSPCRPSRFKNWSTRQAPATCSPPASCSAWCATPAMRMPGDWARSPRRK